MERKNISWFPFSHVEILDRNHYLAKNTEGKVALFDGDHNAIINFGFYDSIIHADSESNYIMVRKNEKVGIINFDGDILLPLEYEDVSKGINEELFPVKKDGKWGLVKTTGEWKIKPSFSYLYPLNDMLLSYKSGGYPQGVVNLKGKKITDAIFDRIEYAGADFLYCETKRKEGVLDSKGTLILKPQFSGIHYSAENLFIVEKKTFANGLINNIGKWIIKPTLKTIGNDFYDGLITAQFEGKYGALNPKGEWVITPEYELLFGFHNGLSAFKQDGMVGLLDLTGNVVLSPQFELIGKQDINGFFNAQKDGATGLIDSKGNWIIEPKFDNLTCIGTGRYLIRTKERLYGVFNIDEHWIVKPEYDSIEPIGSTEYFIIWTDRKYGLINASGTLSLEPTYQNIFQSNGWLVIKDENKYGLLKLTNL